MDLCWMDGKVAPAEEMSVNVLDHGALYGDGVFEGLRFRNGRVFRLEWMLQRLERSAGAINLRLPLSLNGIEKAMYDLITAYTAATGVNHGYIRLVVTRGPGKLGIDPATCSKPNLFMIASQLSMVSQEAREEGISLITASTRKPRPDGVDPRIKSLNYLINIMARMEAMEAGADEAVMLNSAGYVVEGTAENIFVVSRGVLMTPPAYDGALEGVTRAVVLELATEMGMAPVEKRMAPYDLYTAEEIFLTGTGAGLIPCRRIDGREVKTSVPGPVYSKLLKAFHILVEEETSGARQEARIFGPEKSQPIGK